MNINGKIIGFFTIALANILSVAAQSDSSTVYPNFHFNEGIYLSFEEFKANQPSISNFELLYKGGETYLLIPCPDSIQDKKSCYVENAWGYCKDRSVYMHQGYRNNYYRLQVIGALIHFYVIEMNYYDPVMDHSYNGISSTPVRKVSNREMVMEWETGRSFEFVYKNFRIYLSEKDVELYQQLESAKQKRKMIYFYMLKYNERHPVYIRNK